MNTKRISIVRLYTEAFLRLVFPATCNLCHSLLEMSESGFCLHCLKNLRLLKHSPEEALMNRKFKCLDEAWALYPYESPMKEIMAAIKFHKKRWLIHPLAAEMESLILSLIHENHYDLMVPIPTDCKKLLEREFNQSEVLAEILAKRCNIPLQRHLLEKKHSTVSQSQLGQKEREMNLYQLFKISTPYKLLGNSVLLVDDIITTGATAEEAARCLKDAGCKRVDLVTIAHTEECLNHSIRMKAEKW